MAAVDQRGYVFAIDLEKNKYWLVSRTGVSGTSLAFNSVNRRELLVGLSDHTIHCYNLGGVFILVVVVGNINKDTKQLIF